MMQAKYAVGVALVAAVILAAGGLLRPDKDTAPSEAGTIAQADARSDERERLHMPSSADKVSITVSTPSADSANASQPITVTLHIQKGWHVNVNPASLPFLIPTSVQAERSGRTIPLTVRFPLGRESDIRLDGKVIMVYDDSTILAGDFEGLRPRESLSTQSVTIVVTVQSCSDQGICLQPSTLRDVVHLGR